MEEINNFQQEPDETLYQAWERFKELLMKCPQHYLTEMQEVILFYNGLDVPTRQILDSRGVVPTKTAADAKTAIQEMAEYSKNGIMEHLKKEVLRLLTDWNNANPSYQERRQSMEDTLSKFMSESAKRHEENSNLIKEIRATTDVAIRN
ncbi:zf-CCHC domain-containing protein [Tanacetum coccineum]